MPDTPVPGPREFKALVRARIGGVPGDSVREADIVDELAQHVAEHYADLLASGVPEPDAIALALAPFDDPRRASRGAKALAERRWRSPQHPGWPPPSAGSIAGTITRDVRYAIRLLSHAPGFAAAAIITLALGIGANAAIFSVVRAVVLKPPPYRDPSRVVVFLNGRTSAPGSITSSSLPDYEDWQRQLRSFEGVGLSSGWTFNITGLDFPERVFGARVSGSLFPMLGTPPLLGRAIEPDDDRAGGEEVLVLGYRVWQRLFAGDRHIVGTAVMLEGRRHVIVGVMPPQFRFPTDDTEMWAAIKDHMTGMPRNSRFMVAAGRLKDGVSVAAAQAEVDTLSAQLQSAYPETNKGWRVRLAGVHDAIGGDTKSALLVLVGAVGLVLLIACANVSNLLLARAASRRRETAIRLALGAGGGRLLAQWLTENLVLSLAGGAGGVALAYGAVQLVVAFGPSDVPRLDETVVDTAVVAVTVVLAMVAGALPALAPAVRMLRTSSHAALKDGIAGYSAAARGRGGAALIVGEVALAMTLAVAGALLFKSFARLTSVAPGFNPERVLSLKVFLTPPRYRTVASGKQYVRSSLERMAAIPGVESVAAVSQLPLGDPSSTQLFEIEGRAVAPADRPAAGYRAVSAGYFGTLRIPLVRGRALSEEDRENSPLVVVVNEASARTFWPNEDPIGQRIRWATGIRPFDEPWHTVVGVVADVREQRPPQAGAAGDLRPVHAADVPLGALEQLRRAHVRRAAVLRARDSPGADEDRPHAADLSGRAARHGDLAVGRGAAVSHRARRRLRRAGARAVRRRRLRHRRVLGRRANTRDRRAYGPGRDPPYHHAHGRRPRQRLHGHRRRGRHRAVARDEPRALVAAVRRGSLRPRDDRDRVAGRARDRRGGRVPARVPRVQAGSALGDSG